MRQVLEEGCKKEKAIMARKSGERIGAKESLMRKKRKGREYLS